MITQIFIIKWFSSSCLKVFWTRIKIPPTFTFELNCSRRKLFYYLSDRISSQRFVPMTLLWHFTSSMLLQKWWNMKENYESVSFQSQSGFSVPNNWIDFAWICPNPFCLLMLCPLSCPAPISLDKAPTHTLTTILRTHSASQCSATRINFNRMMNVILLPSSPLTKVLSLPFVWWWYVSSVADGAESVIDYTCYKNWTILRRTVMLIPTFIQAAETKIAANGMDGRVDGNVIVRVEVMVALLVMSAVVSTGRYIVWPCKHFMIIIIVTFAFCSLPSRISNSSMAQPGVVVSLLFVVETVL